MRMITELVMVDNPRDRMGKITKGQNETLNGFLISVMRIQHIKRVQGTQACVLCLIPTAAITPLRCSQCCTLAFTDQMVLFTKHVRFISPEMFTLSYSHHLLRHVNATQAWDDLLPTSKWLSNLKASILR